VLILSPVWRESFTERPPEPVDLRDGKLSPLEINPLREAPVEIIQFPAVPPQLAAEESR
jgi:hypothetical protein